MRTKIISIAIILFVVAGFASAYDHRMRIDQQPLATSDAESEQEGKIVDLKADVVYPINLDGDSTVYCLVGNFVAHHNGAVIVCDSAVRYSDKRIKCFGNVLINQGTTYVYGDRAEYNGENNEAEVQSPLVKVVDGDVTLYTYKFKFNTLESIGIYADGGIVTKEDNILESDRGYFYANEDQIICVDNVQMSNDEYQMTGDSVIYNLETDRAQFFTRTNIWNNNGEYIYADRGSYEKENEVYIITKNGYILTEKEEIWSDSLDYYRERGYGLMRHNIQLDDQEHKMLAFGDWGEYWKEPGNALLTLDPSTISYDLEQGDSVFMRADTMFLYSRSTQGDKAEIERKKQEEKMLAEQARIADSIKKAEAALNSQKQIEEAEKKDSVEADKPSRANKEKAADKGKEKEKDKGERHNKNQNKENKPSRNLDNAESRLPSAERNAENGVGRELASTNTETKPAPKQTVKATTEAATKPTTETSAEAATNPAPKAATAPTIGTTAETAVNTTAIVPEPKVSEEQSLPVQDSATTPPPARDSLALDSLAQDSTRLNIAMSAVDSLKARLDTLPKVERKALLKEIARKERDAVRAEKKRLKDSIAVVKAKIQKEKLDSIGEARQLQRNKILDRLKAREDSLIARAKAREEARKLKMIARLTRKGVKFQWADSITRAKADSTLHADYNLYDSLSARLFDSLFAPAADSIAVDSVKIDTAIIDTQYRLVLGYRNVRIFRKDFQAVCDSLSTSTLDSVIRMYIEPVLWQGESQVTSEVVNMYTSNQQIVRSEFTGKPMMVSKIDTLHYNQIAGKTMISHFRDNSIYRNDVDGNAQTIYYMQDEGSPEVQGLMYIESANMTFFIEGSAVSGITYRGSPTYTIYPMDKIPETQPLFLQDFAWHADRRPAQDSVCTRTIRPSERAVKEALPRPMFLIRKRIDDYRERLIRRNEWRDRNDILTQEVIDWLETQTDWKEQSEKKQRQREELGKE